MDKELKAKWVAALRSGKYEQAHEQLRVADSFCCLGVLCDISGAVAWDGNTAVFNKDEGPDEYTEDVELPDGFARRLGLDTAQLTLVRMNDGIEEYAGNPHTFAQIADWIEANL